MGTALADHETTVQSQSVYSTVHVYCTLSNPRICSHSQPRGDTAAETRSFFTFRSLQRQGKRLTLHSLGLMTNTDISFLARLQLVVLDRKNAKQQYDTIVHSRKSS